MKKNSTGRGLPRRQNEVEGLNIKRREELNNDGGRGRELVNH